VFLWLFVNRLRRISSGNVTAADVERTLQDILRRSIVGDKFPGYVFHLPALVRQPQLKKIILYRDARDVASSFMNMIHTKWKGLPWAKEFRSVGDVARQWVRAVEAMEQNRDHLLILRYEDVVREPAREIPRLAEYLRVDPAGFNTRKVHTASIGKSRRYLSGAELQEVASIAGPAMERLGYR
jgi:hypothetical protein